VRAPEVGDKLKLLGAEAKALTSEEFGAFIGSEYERIGAIMRAAIAKQK